VSLDVAGFGTNTNVERKRQMAIAASIRFNHLKASALARNDPLLLTKSDPLSKQDLGAQPTEDPGFRRWPRGARQVVAQLRAQLRQVGQSRVTEGDERS
jgi:hypothetical protein